MTVRRWESVVELSDIGDRLVTVHSLRRHWTRRGALLFARRVAALLSDAMAETLVFPTPSARRAA